ncbi:hypothetical protein [Microbacterium sp.]|uniref:hypothetical protein n=1 Tax=Microbacterium sp. TaxID=51671 RepID=UPI002601AF1F|nr:hypothetical protein [Microbacterium sp.]
MWLFVVLFLVEGVLGAIVGAHDVMITGFAIAAMMIAILLLVRQEEKSRGIR